ncbi:MAG: type IV secretion system DNA-binding domain-containing protein [Pseudomonadota bacterium]
MSARSRSATDHFIRGHEVWSHKLAMFLKAVAWIGLASFAAWMLSFWLAMQTLCTPVQRAIFWENRLATVLSVAGFGTLRMFSQTVQIPGNSAFIALPVQVVEVTQEAYAEHVAPKATIAFLLSLVGALVAAAGLVLFYVGFGREKGKNEFLRGARLVDAKALNEQVQKSREGAGEYKFAGVPIPRGMEMRNILATGGMGSGKSVALLDLADQVLGRGKKSIIWDKTGEFTSLYYRPGKDVILNPFDTRYPGWNIFKEIEAEYEFEQIAHSLAPDPEGTEANAKYFTSGARTLFSAVLRKHWQNGERSTARLVETLLTKSPAELAEYVEGTKAAAYINPKAAEQAGGVISTLTGAIHFLEYVPDGGFSIKEWVRKDDDSRLFITSHESVHDVILPLVSMYLDIAIRAVMTLPKSQEDRLWIWLDEMGSLKHLPILKQSLTEARKYGVVHVIGLQNVAQMRAVFNKDVTQTLRSNLQTYLILRVADEETQEAYSLLIGSEELDEQAEGMSFGASAFRDGTSLQTSRKDRRLVTPTEIKMLPDCAGYLQLAGPFDPAKVSYSPKPREATQPSFLPRPELRLDHSAPAAPKPKDIEAPAEEMPVRPPAMEPAVPASAVVEDL